MMFALLCTWNQYMLCFSGLNSVDSKSISLSLCPCVKHSGIVLLFSYLWFFLHLPFHLCFCPVWFIRPGGGFLCTETSYSRFMCLNHAFTFLWVTHYSFSCSNQSTNLKRTFYFILFPFPYWTRSKQLGWQKSLVVYSVGPQNVNMQMIWMMLYKGYFITSCFTQQCKQDWRSPISDDVSIFFH